MPTFGASAVVIFSRKVLLIKREDAEVWAIPGGAIEAGETIAQAAIREVFEETGIEIQLTRLVGIYSRPRWYRGGDHDVVFAAVPLNGDLKFQPQEVLEAGYFDPTQLPEPLVWWHRQRILDAVNGATGLAYLQDAIWPFDLTLSYSKVRGILKDSGLTKQEAYMKYFSQLGSEGEKPEVGKVDW